MADKYRKNSNIARLERSAERCNEKKALLHKASAHSHNRGQRAYECSICNWHLASYKIQKAIQTAV